MIPLQHIQSQNTLCLLESMTPSPYPQTQAHCYTINNNSHKYCLSEPPIWMHNNFCIYENFRGLS